MSGCKVHSFQITRPGDDDSTSLESGLRDLPPSRRALNNLSVISVPSSNRNRGTEQSTTDAKERSGRMPSHAPWPGLHQACEGCGAQSVHRLGSGPQTCEHCNRRFSASEGAGAGSKSGFAPSGEPMYKDIAVTSSREIALSEGILRTLRWTGAVMLVTSCMLFLLLLIAWQGIDFSMIPVLSPWLAIYLPIPLGLLDGAWSLHCVCRGHFRHQDNASCVSRAGLCGTAWGCSGPSCALNFGLDLGLLITAVLAAFPAGASARGCGYDCYTLLCFPCAPVGGVGMAVSMILMTLGLAFGAAFKMWSMLSALTNGLSGQGFLPW